jgi:hypothetical protein
MTDASFIFISRLLHHAALPPGMACRRYQSADGRAVLTQERRVVIGDMHHEAVVDEADVAAVLTMAVRRPPETMLFATVVITGDAATTKTSFISSATAGEPRMLQVLPTHTTTFCNLWTDPSPADLQYFEEEMSSRRQLPYFPSQLCFGTLHCSPADFGFFLEDEELGNGSFTADAEVLNTAAQSAAVQLTEVGGDMLDSLCSASPSPRQISESEQLAVQQLRWAAAAGAVAYFVDEARLTGVPGQPLTPGLGLSAAHVARTAQRLQLIADMSAGEPVSLFVYIVPTQTRYSSETQPALLEAMLLSALRELLCSPGTVDKKKPAVALHVEALPATGVLRWDAAGCAPVLLRLVRSCAHTACNSMAFFGPLLAFKLSQILYSSKIAARSGYANMKLPQIPRDMLLAVLDESMRGHSHSNESSDFPRVSELLATGIAVPPMVLFDCVASGRFSEWLNSTL